VRYAVCELSIIGLRHEWQRPILLSSNRFINQISPLQTLSSELLGFLSYSIAPKGSAQFVKYLFYLFIGVQETPKTDSNKQLAASCALEISHSITDLRPNDMHTNSPLITFCTCIGPRVESVSTTLQLVELSFLDTRLWLRHFVHGCWLQRTSPITLPFYQLLVTRRRD
jgi:hypothetical protein